MMYNKFNLFLTAILAILLFFTLPANNRWLRNKILDNNTGFFDQVGHLSVEERKESRFGKSYQVYAQAAEKLSKYTNVVLMLPPNEYLKRLNIDDVEMTEPAIFFYFTGVNAVTCNSQDAGRANWALVPKEGKLVVRKIRTRPQLDSIIAIYKPFSN